MTRRQSCLGQRYHHSAGHYPAYANAPASISLTEDYYSTIASDILDGGKVYHAAVDTKPPGMSYI